jgi:ribonucleoside-diphosphate reductase alpha chain
MMTEREGLTHRVKIGGIGGYITANPTEDGDVFEIFVHGFGQLGSVVQGWTDAFAILLSLGLQSGSDLEKFAPLLVQMKFEPNGETDNPEIPECYSIPDYIAQWLVKHHGSPGLQHRVAQIRNAVKHHQAPSTYVVEEKS